MTTRNDIHSPKNLKPADYRHVLAFAYAGTDGDPAVNMRELTELRRAFPFFRKPSGKGGCDVCGAHFRYGSAFRHVSGEHIVVGWECAEQIDAHGGDLANSREAVLRTLERARKLFARRIALRAFVKGATPELRRALRCEHRIVQDIRGRLIQWGQVSAAQEVLVLKIAREEAEKATRPAEVKVPAPEGRQVVRGEVVSVKAHESAFGTTVKMTVKVQAEGGVFLVWCTVPSGFSVARGNQVEFTATLTRSDRDAGFAFGKRPTGARRLEVVS